MTPLLLTDCCAHLHNRRIAFGPQRAGSPAVVHTVNTAYDVDQSLESSSRSKLKQATT
jgi:hypothetical protein